MPTNAKGKAQHASAPAPKGQYVADAPIHISGGPTYRPGMLVDPKDIGENEEAWLERGAISKASAKDVKAAQRTQQQEPAQPAKKAPAEAVAQAPAPEPAPAHEQANEAASEPE